MGHLTEVSRVQIATDFAALMRGKLPDAQIEAAAEALQKPMATYPANGGVVSFTVYMQLTVNIEGVKCFFGRGGGGITPGAGIYTGEVRTDNVTRLFSDTARFYIFAMPVYVNVVFFNSNNENIGSFEARAISSVAGHAGGAGSWGAFPC